MAFDLQKISVTQIVSGLIVLGIALCFSTASFSANKVPTSRVDVPLEAQSNDTGISVPTDTLDKQTDKDSPVVEDPVGIEETREAKPVPKILHDLSLLPDAVRETHKNILAAAASGNIENLRPFIKRDEHATNLSLGGFDGDPIEFLKSTSGDPEGQELLAILTEILEAGYVHMDAGTDEELFVWPYFFSVPLGNLTPPQRVELFRILTFGDLEESLSFGGYIFYRAAIKPDGSWSFFLTGD